MTRDLPSDATLAHVGDDTADWLVRAELLCRLVARCDLAHVPLRFVRVDHFLGPTCSSRRDGR